MPEQEALTTLRSRRRREARVFAARLCLLCAAAAAFPLAAAAGAPAALPIRSAPVRLASPSLAEIARGPAVIPDTALRPQSLRRLAGLGSYWGGEFTAATGEIVTVHVSRTYPEDAATGQRWADFLAGLVHGSELQQLTAYLATPSEVEQICGSRALACYSADLNTLVAPGEDPEISISAEAVVTHEYGHHVAAHRSNAPWSALDYGTKRWASYEQVCSNTHRGRLFPGAETAPRYRLNPGEAFAETYRVLNERKAGMPELSWQVVAQWLYPDDTALAAVEQDVTTPWQAGTASTVTGSLTKTTRARTYTVATRLDGKLTVTLRPRAGARLALDIYSPATRVAHSVGATARSVTTTVCGQRSFRIRVSGTSGAGAFRLAIAKP